MTYSDSRSVSEDELQGARSFLPSTLYQQESVQAVERIWLSKFGYIASVSSETIVAFNGGNCSPFLTVANAAPIRVRSGGNANDAAAGSGAISLTVNFLDEQGYDRTETVATAGESASVATSGSCLRLNRAYVTAGSHHGTNAAVVNIETTSGTLLATIQAGFSQTQAAVYTVPKDHVAYVHSLIVHVNDNQAVDIFMWQTQNVLATASPFPARRIVKEFPGSTGEHEFIYPIPLRFSELTDIECSAAGTTAEVSLRFGIELIKLRK